MPAKPEKPQPRFKRYSTLAKQDAKRTVSLRLTTIQAARLSEFVFYVNTGWESDSEAREALTGALENAGYNVRHQPTISQRIAKEVHNAKS